MAVRAFTMTPLYPGISNLYSIAGLLNGDVSQPVMAPHYGQKTFTVSGTFGAGGNLVCEGSNDGSNFYVVADMANNTLGTITAAGIKDLRGNPRFLRFRVSAGDGTTNLQVDLTATSQTGDIQ